MTTTTRSTAKKTAAPKEQAKETAQEAATSQEPAQCAAAPEEQAKETVTVTVKLKFKDKNTKEVRHVGDVIEVAPERLEEIFLAGNYVEKIEQQDADPAK